ncbi:threonine deaminase, partial [Coemansia sp. RSA 25]
MSPTSTFATDALPNSRTIDESASMTRDTESETATPDGEAHPDYLQMILNSYVYDVASETPLTHAVNLSGRCGNNGVAMSAQRLGIRATIVMPLLTPAIKWQNVRRLGAEVVLHGAGFDEAKIECARLEQLHGLTNIPPFDDPHVIAGQGTIAMELLRQKRAADIDIIFVAVGGGGLIAGIAAYVKRVWPAIRIVAVETADACAMAQSLKAGRRVALSEVGLFADGTAVCQVGRECFRVAKDLVDDVVLVTNDEVCAAIKDVFEDTRSVLEPSGALATAGLKKYARVNGLAGKTLVAVTSGANMNFDRLRFVAERAAMGEQKEVLLSVVIPERAGSFLRLHDVIYPRAITEFTYRFGDPDRAHIFMSFEVTDRAREVPEIVQKLAALSMHATDLSDNELAKSHARYTVGGRSSVPNEYLIRFEFPERHGALKKFLGGLQFDWNISLFQYRNFGQDVAKVLVGVQVPPPSEGATAAAAAAELKEGEIPASLQQFLDDLDYRYVNETNNP